MANTIIKGNQNTTKLINELKKASKQFPPLSKKEEEELIAKNKDDRDKLNHLLFMHNVRIVFNIAKKYMSRTDDFDAMVQDGMLGLSIAANNFDIERGTKFITYAMPWVRKKILERFYLRENEITKRSMSLNSSSSGSKVNDGNETELEDYVNEYLDPSINTVKTTKQQLSANEQSELCSTLYSDLEHDTSLSAVEKNVFIDAFFNKEKTRYIAQKYNLDTKSIATIKDKILKKMKSKLETEYGIHSFSDIYDI